MKQKLIYYSIRSFLFLGKVLPKRSIYRFSHWVLVRYYRKRPKRVEILHQNIERAFPEKERKEVERFCEMVYTEVSKMLAETVLLYHRRIDLEHAVTNKEEAVGRLKHLQSNAPNGILLIAGHYGNWELLGLFLGTCGFPIVNVVKQSTNHQVDAEIITPFRERYGSRMVEHEGAMLALVKALKSGKIASLMIDQVVHPPNGVPVNFFGHPTAATKAVAVLKQKYDPLVVPIFIQRVDEEKFEVKIGDPIEPRPEIYTDKQQQLIDMTQQYYDIIEAQIRQAPEQWLWLYNRWKKIDFEK